MIGKIKSLRELFEIELGYAYDCEQKLVDKGLTSMIEAASSPELRSALEEHLGQTREHVARLERGFAALGIEAKTQTNDILTQLMKAAKDSVGHIENSPLRDAALIVNGNLVEHYEIAMYGSLVSFARQLGLVDLSSSLQKTLEEEKEADAKLSQIGESSANSKAAKYQTA